MPPGRRIDAHARPLELACLPQGEGVGLLDNFSVLVPLESPRKRIGTLKFCQGCIRPAARAAHAQHTLRLLLYCWGFMDLVCDSAGTFEYVDVPAPLSSMRKASVLFSGCSPL